MNERGGATKPRTPHSTQTATNGQVKGNTTAGCMTFGDAGRLARDMIAQAHRTAVLRPVKGGEWKLVPLTPTELRVFWAVIERTITYSKAYDETSTRQLAAIAFGVERSEVTGWQRRHVSNALKVLVTAIPITYIPGAGCNSRVLIGFPEGDQYQARCHDDVPQGDQSQAPQGDREHSSKVPGIAATPSNGSEQCDRAITIALENSRARAEAILQRAKAAIQFANQRERFKQWDEDRLCALMLNYHEPEKISNDVFVNYILEGAEHSSLRNYRRAAA